MSYMALEVAPFCTRVLAPFYLRVSTIQVGLMRMQKNRSFDQLILVVYLLGAREVEKSVTGTRRTAI